MAVHWVRGFRRIGWVLSVPLAALFVFSLYSHTKVFAEYELTALERVGDANPDFLFQAERSGYKAPETTETAGRKPPALSDPDTLTAFMRASTISAIVDLLEKERASGVAHKALVDLRKSTSKLDRRNVEILRVSTLRLIGLMVASLAFVTVVIQGSISLVVWIVRSFHHN